MKALFEMVLGKKNANVMPAGNASHGSSIDFAASRLREKLAEKRLREEKLASQYGSSEPSSVK